MRKSQSCAERRSIERPYFGRIDLDRLRILQLSALQESDHADATKSASGTWLDHEKTSARAEKRCFAPFGGASVHPLRKNRRLPMRRDSNGTHVGIRRDQSWKSTNKDGVVALVTCSRPAKHSRRFTGGLRRVSPVRSSNRKGDPSRYRAQTRVLCVLGLIEDDSAHTGVQKHDPGHHRGAAS